MRRGREHQARRDGGQSQPQGDPSPADRLGLFVRQGCVAFDRSAPARPRRCGHQHDQEDIARAPRPALRSQRQVRFEEQRISEQAGETAEIAGGIEPIGIARLRVRGIPALHQRRLRGHGEKDRPDGEREQDRHPQRFEPLRCGRCQIGKPDGQSKARDYKDDQMDDRLPLQRKARDRVCIGVSGQQQRLIDQHRAVPNRRSPAQLRQGKPCDQRLDEEQQEAARQDRRDEQRACSHAGRRPAFHASLAIE